jgi:GNAT superfamily N-acetyltransferase
MAFKFDAAKHKKAYYKMRKFKLSDLDTVRDLIHNTIDISYSGVYNAEAIKFFKDYHNDKNILKDAKEGYTIVLESNNQIIATGTIIDEYITRVFVNPEFQKHGFGKLIMQKLEEKSLSTGISVIKLDVSLPSKKFYDSFGYITLEKTFVEVENGKKLHYYKMEKSLTSNRLPDHAKTFSS